MPALLPYQETGAIFLADRRAAICGDEMGLGKTVMAIVAADRINARSILVLCPAIARTNWQREFQKWQQTNRAIQVIASGEDAANFSADVVICSYALAPKLRHRHWDLLILDEGQHLKTPATVRTQAVYGKDGLITHARRCWVLSGTLAPNHPGELYPHIRALFPQALGKAHRYLDFLDRFCATEDTIFGTRIKGARLDRLDELAGMLAPYLLQRKQADVLHDLPPMRWGHIVVRPDDLPPQPVLTPEQQALLHSLRTRLPSSADAMHLASLRRWTGITKAPAVAELIEGQLDSGVGKIVVFAIHLAVIEVLGRIKGAAVIHGDTSAAERDDLIQKFQHKAEPRVLILQLTTGGTALTLTAACHVLFAEISWSPADNVQAAARCHRIGQTKRVLAQIVSLAGSIDEVVGATVLRKSSDLAELDARIAERAL